MQRVLIARALYRRPRILFLDEGTANLDQETEARLVAMLNDLEITRIIVAHRPAVFAIADRILHLEDGRITEMEPDVDEQGDERGDGGEGEGDADVGRQGSELVRGDI